MTLLHLRRREMLLASGALAVPALAPAAGTQSSSWPTKPVRIVVPFSPGGLTDAYARQYGEFLAARVGQPVVVDNRPGAGAIIGINFVAKATPDGHTLLLTSSGSVWQNRVLYTKLPYNLDRDLAPVVLFPAGVSVVAVPRALGLRSLRDFVAHAKKSAVAMGTYSPGSFPHMVADQINRSEGTRIQPVHYRGEAPMWVDLAGGQVQIAIGSFGGFTTVSTRGARAIAVAGTSRSPRLPDVPTMLEQGFGGPLGALEGGLPLLVPRGTPDTVLHSLSLAAVAWAQTPGAALLRESYAILAKPKGLAEMREDWDRELPAWIKAAADLGIKLD